MSNFKVIALTFFVLTSSLTPHAQAALTKRGDVFALAGKTGTLVFSARDGALLSVTQRNMSGKRTSGRASNGNTIWRGGEAGLWQARFRDGTTLSAADFSAASTTRVFRGQADAKNNTLRLTFRSDEITVAVTVLARADGADFTARVTPRAKTLLDFALPARLRFQPEQVRRFIAPSDGNMGVGLAFKRAFFSPQPRGKPSAWRQQMSGPSAYAALWGGPLDQRANVEPPAALQVTAAGREWLGAVAARIEGAQAVVNRPPARGQADLTLVDSANGPYFSAKRVGEGALWRLGGSVGDNERALAADLVVAVVEKLAETAASERGNGRNKIGLLSLARGPQQGGWAGVSVSQWNERLRQSRAARSGGMQVVELSSIASIRDALRGGDFLCLLNPYGEWAPVLEDDSDEQAESVAGAMAATVEAVGRYVRAGGHWFETGGYPFFYGLRPVRHFSYSVSYPAAFADFLHLDTSGGAVSLYGIQPPNATPWQGAKNPATIFVPGRLGCGSDARGGYGERAFATFVAPGQTWRSPRVRMMVGNTPEAGLAAYCAANGITRRLEDKMPPALLRKFKNSVLVYYAGSAREKIAHLNLLPVPTQIHFADYLRGGFDKEYPDHLPPRPGFGTASELRELFDRAHALGHIVMPYTNPTWWCDHPRGPTFLREGEAPLLRNLDGTLSYENYSGADGYTVTHWHPAVREANRRTVRQFTHDYPVDVLFQDQVGARSWKYDLNPASPTPYAYIEGMLSQAAEDSKTKPLSTESGWDKVVNYESQLCGLSWNIVPTENGPAWRRLLKTEYPPETWTVFPLAQIIAHDKAAMLGHDLGQFVTNRETLAWMLGLGFSMSYRVQAASLTQDAPREWLRWLDRVQKSVVARGIGQPVKSFSHERGPRPTTADDGMMRATYGPLKIAANLGPRERRETGYALPPFGFVASAPNLFAANLKAVNAGNAGAADSGDEGISFITEGDAKKADVWIYAPAEQRVSVRLPARIAKPVLRFDDGSPVEKTGERASVSVRGNVLRFRLPPRASQTRIAPPASLVNLAPRDWPGAKPAIGILNLGRDVTPDWIRATPDDWMRAFQQSRLAQMGAPIRFITTLDELTAALRGGPAAYHTIVNPYGEKFPVAAPGEWRAMLDAIRSYVERGGSWWETAGYTFHQAISPQSGQAPNGGWKTSSIGPQGAAYLGLPIGSGEVEEAEQALRVTPAGRRWLGDALSARIEKATSMVNRSVPRGADDPGHTALVAGAEGDFIGGYRLGGWGHLWRIGGFWPNLDVALPVAVAATEYLYTHPPQPIEPGGVKYLWHVHVTAG